MTDEEKASIFLRRYFGTYGDDFRAVMIPRLVKLIQDEREVCEQIIREEAGIQAAFAKGVGEAGEPVPLNEQFDYAARQLEAVAETIHARSAK